MNSDPKQDPLLRDVPEHEGYKVLDRCVLYESIGRGGFGVVYKGHHLGLEIDVAIKCLKADLAFENHDFVLRFQREAKQAALINNDNVVRVFDVNQAGNVHYIVMEFVQGENARDRVERKRKLSVEEAVQIALGATRGLAVAHDKGLIHRDVKPDNIMISVDGEVKLADLGLAKPENETSGLTLTDQVVGTPHFMSPEQLLGATDVGPATDVYAMGVTLHFLLTGRHGFDAKSLVGLIDSVRNEPFPDVRKLRPAVPAGLAELVERCTSKDAADRPQEGRELLRLLQAFSTEDESVLEDAGSGSGEVTQSLVSPPPRKTLNRIRLSMDPVTTALLAPKPRRRVSALVGGAVGALAVGLLALALFLFGAQARRGGSDEEMGETTGDGEERRQVAEATLEPTREASGGEEEADRSPAGEPDVDPKPASAPTKAEQAELVRRERVAEEQRITAEAERELGELCASDLAARVDRAEQQLAGFAADSHSSEALRGAIELALRHVRGREELAILAQETERTASDSAGLTELAEADGELAEALAQLPGSCPSDRARYEQCFTGLLAAFDSSTSRSRTLDEHVEDVLQADAWCRRNTDSRLLAVAQADADGLAARLTEPLQSAQELEELLPVMDPLARLLEAEALERLADRFEPLEQQLAKEITARFVPPPEGPESSVVWLSLYDEFLARVPRGPLRTRLTGIAAVHLDALTGALACGDDVTVALENLKELNEVDANGRRFEALAGPVAAAVSGVEECIREEVGPAAPSDDTTSHYRDLETLRDALAKLRSRFEPGGVLDVPRAGSVSTWVEATLRSVTDHQREDARALCEPARRFLDGGDSDEAKKRAQKVKALDKKKGILFREAQILVAEAFMAKNTKGALKTAEQALVDVIDRENEDIPIGYVEIVSRALVERSTAIAKKGLLHVADIKAAIRISDERRFRKAYGDLMQESDRAQSDRRRVVALEPDPQALRTLDTLLDRVRGEVKKYEHAFQ